MLLRTPLLRRYRLPERSDHRTPTELDLTADDVAFPAVDGTQLRRWFAQGADIVGGAPRPVVLVMHGRARQPECSATPTSVLGRA